MPISHADWVVTFAQRALSSEFGFYYDRRRSRDIGKFSSSGAACPGGGLRHHPLKNVSIKIGRE
jgi:hypothetical protein